MINYCLLVTIRHHGSTFIPPVDVFWAYRVTVSAGMVAVFCCGWPDGLELPPGKSPESRCYYRQLQALVENVFVFSISVQLAHQMCYDDALYEAYLLTYLLTILQTCS